jgi:hypothetical protein
MNSLYPERPHSGRHWVVLGIIPPLPHPLAHAQTDLVTRVTLFSILEKLPSSQEVGRECDNVCVYGWRGNPPGSTPQPLQ